MEVWFTDAMRLLSIPEAGPDGHEARTQILTLVRESRRVKADLPAYEDIRRRYAEGVAFQPGTTGEYLLGWLAKHKEAGDWASTTLLSYRRTVERLYLTPTFGGVPLDKLRSSHVLAVFTRVDEESDRIRAAKESEDPAVRKSVAGKRPTGPETKRRRLWNTHGMC